MAKETKAQRVERIKREKDGLRVIEDIHRLAETGEDADAETVDRMKWYGMYTHNEHSSPNGKQYFMLRIKIPGGQLTLEQLKVAEEIARKYGKDTADFTVRQDIQYHWVKMVDLPALFEKLESVGITAQMASGDCPRNIVSCPVCGIDKNEVADLTDVVQDVNQFFQGNTEFSNLPRKYKMGISGCSSHCIGHEIQDLSFNAIKDDQGELLFDVSVGGGLGSNRRIASRFGAIPKDKIKDVAIACARLFRDHGNRENRTKARLGHLVEKMGHDVFQQKVEEQIGTSFIALEEPNYTPHHQRSHFGIHESKQEGFLYAGCATEGGKVGSSGLRRIIAVMEKHGANRIALTTTQNFIILDFPEASRDSLEKDLKEAGFPCNPSPFQARSLACTGVEYCKFGISETKETLNELIQHLEAKFPAFDEPVCITLSGCVNSCSHPHIADLGFIGCKVKEDGESVQGYKLVMGGHLKGLDGSLFARKTDVKIPASKLPLTVENILNHYLEDQEKWDNFREFCQTESGDFLL